MCNDILKYRNEFTAAIYHVNLQEKKLLCAIFNRYQNDPNALKFGRFSFSAKQINELVGIPKNSYKELGQVCENLMQRIITIHPLTFNIKTRKADPVDKNNWEKIPLINYGKYADGVLTVGVPRELQIYFMHVSGFYTQYKLENIKKLRSAYSIRLYELLKQYQNIGKRYFSYVDLKTLLGCEKKYPSFSNFKQIVLNKAYVDFKKHCDIYFEFVEKKEGRKVTSVEFRIYKNETQVPGIEVATIKELESHLEFFNVNIDVKRLIHNGTHTFKELQASYKAARAGLVADINQEIKSVPGYIYKALEKKWKQKISPEIVMTDEDRTILIKMEEYHEDHTTKRYEKDFLKFANTLDSNIRHKLLHAFDPEVLLTDKRWSTKIRTKFLEYIESPLFKDKRQMNLFNLE